ncbi:RNA ligase family protein [Bremerella cremea]|uniref:RNA ligase family protein n=1 Tax=Bremerella cremea TaxID=1031537 RepID=UPI0031EF5020
MNRKLHYPKIRDSRDFPLGRCIAFEKLDGTNLHFVWKRTSGWIALGTRRDRFTWDHAGREAFAAAHGNVADAAELFEQQWTAELEVVFQKDERCQSWQVVEVFAEYCGPNSFAGLHKHDDPKRLVMFDVAVDGEMLGPFEFIELFRELPIARVVFQGKFNSSFAERVREGKLDVIEGVVCKTGTRGNVQMAKIKSNAYRDRLQQSFGERWEDHWE